MGRGMWESKNSKLKIKKGAAQSRRAHCRLQISHKGRKKRKKDSEWYKGRVLNPPSFYVPIGIANLVTKMDEPSGSYSWREAVY